MQSAVGTASPVLISNGINFRESLSIRSRNGILIPAFPIRTLGFFLIPEIINAVSGDAFTYPDARIPPTPPTPTIKGKATVNPLTISLNIYLSSYL